MPKKEKTNKRKLEDLKKNRKKLKDLLRKESKLLKHRTLEKPLSYNEKEMLRKSQKDIKLDRVKLFEPFLRDRKRLKIALRERCTGPYILYPGLGLGKVIVLPLEIQLANWNGKVLKEPNLIEELD